MSAPLTVKDVRREVANIARMAGDDEGAHAAEDALHQEVLQAIAAGAADAPALARAALKTRDIEFSRWCA